MATKQYTADIEQLQAQINKLAKRIARLEQERDEARENVVVKQLSRIIKDQCLFRHNGQYLSSEAIRLIRRGEMTTEQAIAERNSKYPLFQVWDGTIGLGAAYQLAV